MSSTTNPSEHLAAILPQKGGPLSVSLRPTPEPGPNELLIEVHAVALNPVDVYQRDYGMPPIATYPTVLGCDIAGTVVKSGSGVSADAPQPGTRVAGFASAFYLENNPDYGAFQKYVLVYADNLAPLPDHLSFEQGAVLPMAALVPWTGWALIGITQDTKYTPEEDKQAVLVWGGSSSVGSGAIQSAKILGFTVYTTASKTNHEYLKTLGADRVFDYKDADVVAQIISAARADGVTIQNAFDAVANSLEPTIEILKELKGDAPGRIAHAPLLPDNAPTVEGIEAKFCLPPLDATARQAFFFQTYRVWLSDKLASGEFVPSPHVRVMEGGLEGLNRALDTLKEGVSCTKIVLQL